MKATTKMALLSIATSIVTLALKFGAYFITGSVGMLSDALEAFVNLAAGLAALGAITIAEQPADDQHTYGYDKAEYFSSGVEGILIIIAAVSIGVAATQRFMHPAEVHNIGPGLVVGLLAAAMNFATARAMLKVAKKHDSITIEADARHLLTDVWTTGGVLAGLVVIMIVPEWHILDPIIAIAVAVHIVFTGIELLRRTTQGLMDAALPPNEIHATEQIIRAELPPTASFHDLRTRKAGARRFIEFHMLVPGATSVMESHAWCDRIEESLARHLAKVSVTIHVEPAETEAPHEPGRATPRSRTAP
ncbi:MAG TPA: cation diffusion facilitator family transporter [Burkholderiales bacterium]